MEKRAFFVAVVGAGCIVDVPGKHLSLREALAFMQSYNRANPEHTALVGRHPIARAISTAKAKSLAS
jgi:hypothetical protein